MRRIAAIGWTLALLATLAGTVCAQNERDLKVRRDREQYGRSDQWIYNDLPAAMKLARERNRPVFVVFRCIPCEACHEFDEQVAARDPVVRDLMEQFVCVRVIQANGLDLLRFQHDFDQSFAGVVLHPDGTILGRFGTRSGRTNEKDDISLDGLRDALTQALALFNDYPAIRPALEPKQVQQALFPVPEDFPRLRGKYTATIDYEGATAKSCIHCHMVGEAERAYYRDRREPIPDRVLFGYPHPRSLGLDMEPTRAATVKAVAPGSLAAAAGFRPGDRIVRFDGQPPIAIADLQWVLHNAADPARIPVQVDRAGQPVALTLDLPKGWRHASDISWRATTWDLRRMAFGGMVLEPLPDPDRQKLGLDPDALALRVKSVGQYGDHARAKNAGVQPGDVLVRYDTIDHRATESDLIAHAVQQRRPGDTVDLVLLRPDAPRRTIRLDLQ